MAKIKREIQPIGVARTPYSDWAPHQPLERDTEAGVFKIIVEEQHVPGLDELDRFSHLIVLSYLHETSDVAYRVRPPWAKGREVGLWASRTPNRPNPIGLSIVRILKIEGGEIHVSPIDLLDGTPVIDLKPYIRSLDARQEANDGWIEDIDGHDHLLQHLRGVPHGHDHGHGHDHDHGHGHDHDHDHEHE